MRRLLTLVSALVLVDTMLFAALTPLLGHFVRQLHLSSATAGVLVAAYAAGALLGGLPGGVAAARLGPRRAVLTGLTLMGLASLGFAWAESFPPLLVARFVQGAGSAFTWAGAFAWLLAATPRARRGQVIGTAMGAAVFGALIGPVLGAAAALLGRDAVFSAVAGLAVVLAAATLRIQTRPPEQPSWAALARAGRNAEFAAGLALLALGALLFGVLSVLAPLHLTAAGWGPTAIGAVWLVGAAIETALSPLVGRISDRRGALAPVRPGLAAGAVVSLALILAVGPLPYALLVLAASTAYGVLFTPSFKLIADGADHAGLAQGMAFGMMNAAWALGAFLGPAAAGAIAGATGASVPLLLAALACAGALAATVLRARASARLAGHELAGAREPAVPAIRN
ncbi:MAG TPA: MFS transporter [Solirubrobacteraceae bacterium]|nr:MFS transporter [Solirubrobacteraceae bacterium]